MAKRRDKREDLRAERLRREAEEQARQRSQRLLQYGSATGLLAILIIVVLIVVSQSGGGSGGDTNIEGAAAVERQLAGIPQHGTVLGNDSAKSTVIEFADLQCPVCQAFSFEVGPELIADVVRKGIASYDLRQYTIIGPDSTDAATAALAAGEQNRYWHFVELFYRNQGEENSGYVTDDFLTSIAKGAGVPDIERWNADRQSSRWDAVLTRTQVKAQELGFSGTPSILVKGPGGSKVFSGSVPSAAQIEAAVTAVG